MPIDELRGLFLPQIMGHGRAEPDAFLHNNFLADCSFVRDGRSGRIFAAVGGNSGPFPLSSKNTVGRRKGCCGKDQFRAFAFLPDDSRYEGRGAVHEEFLAQPKPSIVKAPEGAICRDSVGMDEVHCVHGIRF